VAADVGIITQQNLEDYTAGEKQREPVPEMANQGEASQQHQSRRWLASLEIGVGYLLITQYVDITNVSTTTVWIR